MINPDHTIREQDIKNERRPEAARAHSSYRSEGSPQTIEEYLAGLMVGGPAQAAQIEAVRQRLRLLRHE